MPRTEDGLVAPRSIEHKPVRGSLCETAEHWPWSSAEAHLRGADDNLFTAMLLCAEGLDHAFDKAGEQRPLTWREWVGRGFRRTRAQRLRVR